MPRLDTPIERTSSGKTGAVAHLKRRAAVNPRVLLLVLFVLPCHSNAHSKLPRDITQFMERRDACDHFRGEEPYDAARRKFLEDKMRQVCLGTDRKLAALKLKYKNQAKVLVKLGEYEPRIESAGDKRK
jgi:hypothetical protein